MALYKALCALGSLLGWFRWVAVIMMASRGTFAPLPPLPGPRPAAAFPPAGEDVLVLGGAVQPRGRTVTAWRLAGGKIP